VSKYLAEKEVLKLADNNFIPIVFRKGTVYGYSPRMRFDLIVNTMVRDALLYGKLHIFCRGKQWRPLVSIEDVATAYLLALEAPKEKVKRKIINIAAGNYQVKDVANEVKRAFKNEFNMPITLVYEQDNKKDRSYKVETTRAERLLSFKPTHTIYSSVCELVSQIQQSKKLQKFDNSKYYNILQMKPLLEKMKPLSM
jgi:nucleoside-diphosphate-sugar epimerase